jgi:uncharacterized membrane protein
MATGQKLPTDRLRGEVQNLLGALGDRALDSVRDKVGGVTERLTDYAEEGAGGGSSLIGAVTGARELAEGKSPGRALLGAGTATVKDKVKNLFGGGGKGGGKKLKLTSIVESIDVGVPVRVAYNQWTQFSDFPSFMKKVENAEQDSQSAEKVNWKAQVWWSHRSWESTIQSQIPDQQIVWRSKGEKGHVDGSVTFHELSPNLTRILVVLEYHPQGLFERTGNLWRAQGRRARLELKHFRRHVMTNVILHPDEVEGWRGVIEDGRVVKDHETAVREEQERDDADDGVQSRDGDRDTPEDELPEDEQPEDELPEDELPEDELPEDELPEDELPEDEQPEDDLPEDEQPEDEQPEERRSGNGRRSGRGRPRTRAGAEPAGSRRSRT